MIIALLGKPLSGKDTVARHMALGFSDSVLISPGEIIREVQREGDSHRFWPLLASSIPGMEQGVQAPDDVINELLVTLITEEINGGKKTIILAGSPRSLAQLDALRYTGLDIRGVLIDTTDEETYKRSAARGEGRVDDNPEAHKKRLDAYYEHIVPVLHQLAHEGRLTIVDGMREKDEVYREVEPMLPMRARR